MNEGEADKSGLVEASTDAEGGVEASPAEAGAGDAAVDDAPVDDAGVAAAAVPAEEDPVVEQEATAAGGTFCFRLLWLHCRCWEADKKWRVDRDTW